MNDHVSANGMTNIPSKEIDSAILAELTRALLPYLGPYSITTVKRAGRASDDPHEAVRMIAEHIDDLDKRELFLKSAKRILGAMKGTGHHATGGRPATPITPELMRRGESALAPIIGPLAGVLVMRYAQAAGNSRDFFERLAGHLRTAEERDTFFMRIRGAGSIT